MAPCRSEPARRGVLRRAAFLRDERGGVTVEFAVALPVVAIVVVSAIAGVLAVDAQGRLQLAASTAARAYGRGDDPAARTALDRLAPGAGVDVDRSGGLVCVTAARVAAGGPLRLLSLRASGCAADRGG